MSALNRTISVENATPITGLAGTEAVPEALALESVAEVEGPLDVIGEESDSQNNSISLSGRGSATASTTSAAAASVATATSDAKKGGRGGRKETEGGNDTSLDRHRHESTDSLSRSTSLDSDGSSSRDRSASSSDQSLEGEITLGRDSIFQHSKHANQSNRLHDWSFIDEGMLLAASQKGKTPSISEKHEDKNVLGAAAAASAAAAGGGGCSDRGAADGSDEERRGKKKKKKGAKSKGEKDRDRPAAPPEGVGQGSARATEGCISPKRPGKDSDRERITLTSASGS